ncbi:zinc finger CCCH domain-containing protein 56-like [Iris pallida]|nr:zinc finger CCCH domain-containing protein 56-like [Iris pallida]
MLQSPPPPHPPPPSLKASYPFKRHRRLSRLLLQPSPPPPPPSPLPPNSPPPPPPPPSPKAAASTSPKAAASTSSTQSGLLHLMAPHDSGSSSSTSFAASLTSVPSRLREFRKLSNLEVLDLGQNMFFGSIQPFVKEWASLKVLLLDNNQLNATFSPHGMGFKMRFESEDVVERRFGTCNSCSNDLLCKKFYTGEGCPNGDMCTFVHDEHSKAQESVAISLSLTVGGGGYGNGANGSIQKPSNWKTRICNKWETTSYCPFGSKCHFAHGMAELHKYGGKLMGTDGRDTPSAAPDAKQTASLVKALTDVVASNASVPHSDIYHMGVPVRRSTVISQRQGQRPLQKWKGPDKISRIYGIRLMTLSKTPDVICACETIIYS